MKVYPAKKDGKEKLLGSKPTVNTQLNGFNGFNGFPSEDTTNYGTLKKTLLPTKREDEEIELESLSSLDLDDEEEELYITSHFPPDDNVKKYLTEHNCNILANSSDARGDLLSQFKPSRGSIDDKFNEFISNNFNISCLKNNFFLPKDLDDDCDVELESLCSTEDKEEDLFSSSVILDDNVKEYLTNHNRNILQNVRNIEGKPAASQIYVRKNDPCGIKVADDEWLCDVHRVINLQLCRKQWGTYIADIQSAIGDERWGTYISDIQSMIGDERWCTYIYDIQGENNYNILRNGRSNPSISQRCVGEKYPLLKKQFVTGYGGAYVSESGIKVAEGEWLSDVHRVIDLQLSKKQWGTHISDIQSRIGGERWRTEILEIERKQGNVHDWNTSIQEIYGGTYQPWSMAIADKFQNKELPRHWSSTINNIEKVGKCKGKWTTVFRKINGYFRMENEWKTKLNAIEKRSSKDKWKFRLADTLC